MKKLYNILEINRASEFSCIGPECEDTCCREWTITIDKKTYFKYMAVKDKSLRDKIKKAIKITKRQDLEYGIMKLDKNKRCMLLREDDLCTLHREVGEEYLCRTCRVYPKIFNNIDGNLEYSLTLSCPEAARKILLDREKKSFNFIEKEVDIDFINNNIKLEDVNDLRGKLFWEIRSAIIDIFQNDKLEIWQRAVFAGLLSKKIDPLIKEYNEDEVKKTIEMYLLLLKDDEIDINLDYDNAIKKDLLYMVYKFLIDIFKKCSIEGYKEKLNILEKYSDEEINEKIINNINSKVSKYIDENTYIFENYIVNYIFQNIIPLQKGSITNQIYKTVFNYSFIMVLLSARTIEEENITEDIVIEVIHTFTKCIGHNSCLIKCIEDEFKRNNMYDLSYITLLIK